MKNILFGDYTPEELEKFEKDSNGIVVFNGFGENAISFQKSAESIVFYADKIVNVKNEEPHYRFPNLFNLDDSDIVKLMNFLYGFVRANPDRFHFQHYEPK